MQEPVLNPIANLANATSAVNTINANSVTTATALQNTLDRYGSAPNQMNAVLDMNSFNIINLPSPATINSPARLIDVVSNPTISVPTVGTSGSTVPLLNGINTWTGTQTFTGATVNLPSITSVGTLDITGTVVLSGSTSGTTTLQASAIAGTGTLTLPSTATDTLAGAASTTTFTNKTYDTAGTGNVFKINGTSITSTTGTGSVVLAASPTLTGTTTCSTLTAPTITGTGAIQGSGASATVGYLNGSGAGGAITQLTSKATGVTLNNISGQITMNNASLSGSAAVSFVLTNSTIAANDVVIVNIASGATAVSNYLITVGAVSAGSCTITLYNDTASTARTDALVLNFVVIKGASS